MIKLNSIEFHQKAQTRKGAHYGSVMCTFLRDVDDARCRHLEDVEFHS